MMIKWLKQLLCRHQVILYTHPITMGVFYGGRYTICQKCGKRDELDIESKLKKAGLL
jgi:hypothetical protein